MRIAYIINSLEGGGAAFPVPAVTSVFRNAGHTVAIFALARKDGLAEAPMRAAGLDVLTCPADLKDHTGAMRWLLTTLRSWNPSHLWTSLTRATLLGQQAGLILGKPVASWQHSARLKPANRQLLRATRSLSDLWIGDSRFVTDITRENLAIPADRLTCWPIFRASETAPQSQPWHPGTTVRLGSLGRLHPVKGYSELLQALASLKNAPLPPFTLTLTGEGPERHHLEQQIRESGLTGIVNLPGFTTETGQALASLHLYLQPSHREGFCIAAHEAMQAALPVISSDVGQLHYSVQNGLTGLRVRPRNPEALAEALFRTLSAPEKLHQTGQNARKLVLNEYSSTSFTRTGLETLEKFRQLSDQPTLLKKLRYLAR